MVSRTVPGSPGEECGLGVRWGRALTAWVPGLESVDRDSFGVDPRRFPPGLGWNNQQQPRSHKPPVAGLIPLPDSGTPCGVPV